MHKKHRSSKLIKLDQKRQAVKNLESYWLDPNEYMSDIARLKLESPMTIRMALREAPSTAIRLFATGNPFPNTYDSISKHPTTHFSENIATELTWTTEVLCQLSQELNTFLETKRHFDQALLRNDFSAAQYNLDQIQKEFGQSFWLINSHLLLAEYRGGLKENREFLQTLRNNSPQQYTQFIAAYYSQRTEKNLSSSNYDKEVASFRKAFADQPERDAPVEHICFILAFSSLDNYKHLDYILHRESVHPAIDRYANYIRILSILQATADAELLQTVRACVLRASEQFRDSRLLMLRHLHEPSTPVKPSEQGRLLMTAIDSYTSGDYQSAEKLSLDALNKYPDCFEFYELNAEASLHLEQKPSSPFAQQSLASEILNATFDVLNKSDKTVDSLRLLRKLAGSLDGMQLADQLLAFVLNQENPRHALNPRLFGAINSSAPTPRVSSLFRARSDSRKYLDQLTKITPVESTARLFAAVHGDPPFSQPVTGIPETRWQNYKAYALMRSGDFAGAASIYRQLLDKNRASPPLKQRATLGLLECLLNTRQFRESAELIVDTYLNQRALLISVSLDELVKNCQENPDSALAGDICWPIACYIHYSNKGELKENEALYYACEDFLNSIEIERPSELNQIAESLDQRKLIFFLRYICIPEVLDFSIAYGSSADLENERIKICQWLLLLDPKNAEIYSREISELTQAGMIRSAMIHLDESKVYIDTKGIAHSLDSLFKERFERYVSYSRLDQGLRANLSLKGISFKEDEDIFVVSDAGLHQFSELFNELKNRFISSNEYGLDSYLSVRIRHGTLSGQIRSQFEKENLITRRSNSDGAYDKNDFWSERVFSRFGSAIENSADAFLREFSHRIDSIIETVKSKWIQIKGPSNAGEGLFDFDYTNSQILDLYIKNIKTTTYNSFLQAIFNELWNRTTDNLARVVNRIKVELREQLTEALDTVAGKIFDLHGEIRHSSFGDAVTRCRTGIQNEIETISAWFRAASEKAAPDFKFTLLSETATEVVRRCFPTSYLWLETSISTQETFKGESFAGFVDVLFILLENIVRHSRPPFRPKLDVSVQDSRLSLRVSNPIGPSVDTPVLQAKISNLNNIKSNTTLARTIRTEGGSGYYKLHKLIRHDLDRGEDYSVSISITDAGAFEVIIEMGLKGLLHANSRH
ncbi:tetratricopeptide repeat protein [Archangium violaceum]|uniref:tetratricopeptide repeat protein n=1 Tax=Archangium violaceum TaxID=83451 RepID=UPI0019527816|nr:tetratricopeptide repeat protein [Archangium violaceum]QRN95532.1 tetratricopeptide repeat protein [Archangium violaceum]